MTTGRLEAFSDGVLAIVITIMVLELRAPHGDDWAAMRSVVPVFLTYVMSFIYIGIYWNNHHHTMLVTRRVTGVVLWANLHLLFWLSLVPFVTGWMGENHFAAVPVALYGSVLLACALAYSILIRTIIAADGRDSTIAHAIGADRKGNLSLVLYVTAIPAALWIDPRVAIGLYIVVALIWLAPDPRIERTLRAAGAFDHPAGD